MARRSHDRWTEAHVKRLFWRARFDATAKEARYWAARSRGETIDWLLRGGPGPPRPRFPKPRLHGKPLDPINEYGQDVLWWLDKMVRTPRPLVEKTRSSGMTISRRSTRTGRCRSLRTRCCAATGWASSADC